MNKDHPCDRFLSLTNVYLVQRLWIVMMQCLSGEGSTEKNLSQCDVTPLFSLWKGYDDTTS